LNNVPLSCVASCIDLGVCVNSVLSFSAHINNVVAKAKQRKRLLLRSFLSKDAMLLTKAFIVYVRSMIEYCSPVSHLAILITSMGVASNRQEEAIASSWNLPNKKRPS